MKSRIIASIIASVAMVFGGVAVATPAQAAEYDPTFISAGYTLPVCFNGVLDNDAVIRSFNDPGGFESITFSLDGQALPGFPYALPTGSDTEYIFDDVVPADTSVGDHTLTVDNYGFTLATYQFTLTDPCVAVSPSDFGANLNPQAVADDGTLIQSVEFGNFSEASRIVSIWLDDALVHTMNVASGDVQSYIMTIPRCKPYNVKVDFGFPEYILDVVEPAFGCASPPEQVGATTVTGKAQVGQKLTCNASFTGTPTPVVTKRWYLNGVATSITGSTFMLTASHVGKRVSCGATATNESGSVGPKMSASTSVVVLGPALKPVVKPRVAGTSSPGKTLTAKVGSWSPAATSYKYQWQRLVKGKWVNIAKATGKTYKVPKSYDNKYLRVVVTALKAGYNKGVFATARVYI